MYSEVFSKDKLYKVSAVIKVDQNTLEVTAVFQNQEGKDFSRKTFFRTEPEALYHYHLGAVVWSGENEVTLYGSDKKEFWTVSF